jgi:hypothetical protein
MLYIRDDGTHVTGHHRPHGESFERRPKAPGLNLSVMEAGEPAPYLYGYRLAYVDHAGAWRIRGSDRLVAAAPVRQRPTCPRNPEHGPMEHGNPTTREQIDHVEDGGAFWACPRLGCCASVLEPPPELQP